MWRLLKNIKNHTSLLAALTLLALSTGVYVYLSEHPEATRTVHADGGTLTGYAWSDNIGWISFSGIAANSTPYGVTVANDGTLSGYAWSDSIGWIGFGGNSCGTRATMANGALTGWAQASSSNATWDGCIKLADTAAPAYGPSLNGSGELTGFSWGTDPIGWISYNCLTGGPTSNPGVQVHYLTSGTVWDVPADWNNANYTIEVLGGGGGGANGVTGNTGNTGNTSAGGTGGTGGNGGGGGGGGAYAKITQASGITLTPNSTVSIRIGAAGGASTAGGDTYFNGASCAAASTCAKGGNGASGTTAGTGGSTASSVGSTKYAGGNGATGTGGSGGSAGTAYSESCSKYGCTSSGGAGGAGGAGGVGRAGGGAAGLHGAGGNASASTGGTGDAGYTAAAGNGTQWGSYGSGGGANAPGGTAGNYGAGGAGGNGGAGGAGGAAPSTGGSAGGAGSGASVGKQGLIVVTYTPNYLGQNVCSISNYKVTYTGILSAPTCTIPSVTPNPAGTGWPITIAYTTTNSPSTGTIRDPSNNVITTTATAASGNVAATAPSTVGSYTYGMTVTSPTGSNTCTSPSLTVQLDKCTDISGIQQTLPTGCTGPTPSPSGVCIPSGYEYRTAISQCIPLTPLVFTFTGGMTRKGNTGTLTYTVYNPNGACSITGTNGFSTNVTPTDGVQGTVTTNAIQARTEFTMTCDTSTRSASIGTTPTFQEQ